MLPIWGCCTSKNEFNSLESIHCRAVRVIYNLPRDMPFVDVRKTANYKIAKIERALWLAERSVCMRVFKHGCDVKMFCFSRANLESIHYRAVRVIYNLSRDIPFVDVRKTANYKIAKIERALWLAERSVCMRVFKHGCDVKMFCFSRANHASWRIWKRFWVQNSTSLLYLPIPSSAETWKIFTNKLCQFFSSKLTF